MSKKIVMTAVQQLIHDMRNIDMSIFNDEHCKKYLEMEKQQIIDAVNKFALGSDEVVRIILKKYNLLNTGEAYYNETYK